MFKKKKENIGKLPDLPPAPTLRTQLPPIMPLKESAPTYPNSSAEIPIIETTKNNKKEIQSSEIPKLPSLPGFKKEIIELPEVPFEEKVIPAQVIMPENTTEERGPIFVKIEKFKSAKGSIDKIQEKLKEIDELLKKTREIREKEEQELVYWEKEMQDLKIRLNRINESIFEKIK